MISEKRKRETCSPQTFGHRLYKKIGAKRRTTTLKFESRDEWLGIRGDWDSPASSSRAQPRDLYCIAGISVYAPRENDVLVLPHIRR